MPFAMVRIAAFYVAGVCVGIGFPEFIDQETSLLLFILFSVSYFPGYFLTRKSRNIKFVTGSLGLMAIVLAGTLQVKLQDEKWTRGNYFVSDSVKAFVVKLTVPPEEKAKSWKRAGVVVRIHTSGGWQTVESGINLFFAKSDSAELLDYGDQILVYGTPRTIEPAYNPAEFDFRRHYASKHIFLQHRVDSGKWRVITYSSDKGFLYHAQRMRRLCVGIIKKYIPDGQEQGILMALVLGVTDGLDNEVLNAYAASGAMHVLAVSGMHVSILYAILLFVLKPVKKSPASEWVIAILCLLLLWMYAFITGLSPSVLRAVTMFSFVAVAKPMARNTNIYNTLAASAFILLLYDPWLILSVGFQLSYLAVLGIVYLQRPLTNLWAAPNALLHWVWQITTVSIAAQMATVSLSLYYFHQFPTYFLLANLVVIPASTVVLVGGILLLAISPIAVLATPLGIALQWCTEKMDQALFFTEQLPGSLWQPINLPATGAVALFVMLLCAVLLFQYRRFAAWIGLIVAAWVMTGSCWWQVMREEQHTWITYRLPGHHAVEWITKGESWLSADSALLANASRIKFSIYPCQVMEGVRSVHMNRDLRETHGLRFFCFGGKVFMWIASPDFQLPAKLPVDAILISNNAVRTLRSFQGKSDSVLVVLDASNFRSRTVRLMKEATATMSVHAVWNQGALVTRW